MRKAGSAKRWHGCDSLRVYGINFEVATMGSGDRLALCLHGFPEHAYSCRHQMPLLARLGYRVWAPNLRGYGATDSPREVAAYRTNTLVDEQYVSDLTFRVLPGVSHWIQQEAPEEVNAMLEAWLTGKRVPEYRELAPVSNLSA